METQNQNNSAPLSKIHYEPWQYLYAAAYLYALDHPGEPDRWWFCDEALRIRDEDRVQNAAAL